MVERKEDEGVGGLVMSKKRRKLLPFNPTEDPVRRLEQMASLATSLNATGAEFSNEHIVLPLKEMECRGGRKKQNVKCLRFDVAGECRVLLIASREIRKGERLYYDYNGYENEYPTENFV